MQGKKLIFFAPLINEGDRQINNLIDSFTAVSSLEIYRTIDSLSERLREPQKDNLVAVLFAISKETLSEIISIRDLLSSPRVIIVLPDREADTIAKGHMLRPRFMTYSDTDFGEISAVIDKMFGNVAYRQKPGRCETSMEPLNNNTAVHKTDTTEH